MKTYYCVIKLDSPNCGYVVSRHLTPDAASSRIRTLSRRVGKRFTGAYIDAVVRRLSADVGDMVRV